MKIDFHFSWLPLLVIDWESIWNLFARSGTKIYSEMSFILSDLKKPSDVLITQETVKELSYREWYRK